MIQWFLGGRGQKWPWPVSSWDPKICCILKMNLWIELIWCNNFCYTDILWVLNVEGPQQLYFLFFRKKLESQTVIYNFITFFILVCSLEIFHIAYVSFLMTFEDPCSSKDLKMILILLWFPFLGKYDYIHH